jgi:hypothetical protein
LQSQNGGVSFFLFFWKFRVNFQALRCFDRAAPRESDATRLDVEFFLSLPGNNSTRFATAHKTAESGIAALVKKTSLSVVDAQIRDLFFCCKNLQKDLVHLKLQEDL